MAHTAPQYTQQSIPLTPHILEISDALTSSPEKGPAFQKTDQTAFRANALEVVALLQPLRCVELIVCKASCASAPQSLFQL